MPPSVRPNKAMQRNPLFDTLLAAQCSNHRNHQLPAATRLLNWPKLYAEQQLEILSGCQTTFRIGKVDAGANLRRFMRRPWFP